MHGLCRHYCVWNNGTHPIKNMTSYCKCVDRRNVDLVVHFWWFADNNRIFHNIDPKMLIRIKSGHKSFISVRQLASLYLSPSLSVVIHSIDFSALFCASLSGFWSPSRYLANISLMGHFLWISRPSTHPHPDLPPRLLAILCWLFPWLHHFWLSLVRSDFSILVGRWMKMWGEFWWSAFVFFKTQACVMLLVVCPAGNTR